jgi:Uma2 family endonuclease
LQEDGKYPNVIVESLSSSTAAIDKGLKKQVKVPSVHQIISAFIL